MVDFSASGQARNRFDNLDGIEYRVLHYLIGLDNTKKTVEEKAQTDVLRKLLYYDGNDALDKEVPDNKIMKDIIWTGVANENARIFFTPRLEDAELLKGTVLKIYIDSIVPDNQIISTVNIGIDIVVNNNIIVVELPEVSSDFELDEMTVKGYNDDIKSLINKTNYRFYYNKHEYQYDKSGRIVLPTSRKNLEYSLGLGNTFIEKVEKDAEIWENDKKDALNNPDKHLLLIFNNRIEKLKKREDWEDLTKEQQNEQIQEEKEDAAKEYTRYEKISIPIKSRVSMIVKSVLSLLNGADVQGVGKIEFSRQKSIFNQAQYGIWNHRACEGMKIVMGVKMSGVS